MNGIEGERTPREKRKEKNNCIVSRCAFYSPTGGMGVWLQGKIEGEKMGSR